MNPENIKRFIRRERDILFLFTIFCAMVAYNVYDDVKREVTIYRNRINQSPAVVIFDGTIVPWRDCYPLEEFPPTPVRFEDPTKTVMEVLYPLDPLRDTWTFYENFVKEKSPKTPDGEFYGTFIVPDIDWNGDVCGIRIGDQDAQLLP